MKSNAQLPQIKEHEVKTQINAVLWHLQNKGSITSWEAIKEYGATRLSAIIYNLRHTRGYTITGEDMTRTTRFGQTTTFTKYIYKKENVQSSLWDRMWKSEKSI